jgi:GNAT superfamily N-acetyltransferase
MSRLLADLEAQGLLERSRPGKGRTRLSLTAKGRRTFTKLDANARMDVARLLAPLQEEGRRRVIDAMDAIESSLGRSERPSAGVALREPEPGDLGWVVARHGALYGAGYGFNRKFEAMVAQVVADFVTNLDPKRERCWIAELDRRKVGSVLLVKQPDAADTARLRLLLVEPEARGIGVGRRLVDECTRFARQARYRSITLGTYRMLTSARRIYEAAGYRLVEARRLRSFGKPLVDERWELTL